MARPLRFIPASALVEITTRILQGNRRNRWHGGQRRWDGAPARLRQWVT